jgi:arylsulfatase A-like enzyme
MRAVALALALALGAPGCTAHRAAGSPAATLLNLARATARATRLEVDRKALLPRTAVRTPASLAWRATHASLGVDESKGLAIQGDGDEPFTVDAELPTTPTVDYVVRAVVVGTVSVRARVEDKTGTELSNWEDAVALDPKVPADLALRIVADGRKMQLRFAGRGTVSVSRLEVREASHRKPAQVVSSEDRELRAWLRFATGEDQYSAREALLATGQSSYEWPLDPASEARVIDLETALVARHDGADARPAPLALAVEARTGGAWREAYRVERGTAGDGGGWTRASAEIAPSADAIRLVTRAIGDARGGTVTIAWGRPIVRPKARGTRPDVVIVTIDALRADKLGVYGNTDGLTPTIDGLGARGVVFDEARTPRGQTWEAMTSLAMGTRPEEVGVLGRGDHVARGYGGIAKVFADAGYATLRVGNVLLPAGQLGDMEVEDDSPKDEVSVARLEELLEVEHDRPVFAWIHLAATHYPFNISAEFLPAGAPAKTEARDVLRVAGEHGPPEKIAELGARADAAIREDDALVARLLRKLEAPDRPGGPALVAVAADHGSHRGEDGIWFMHSTVHRVVLRIPLIVAWPGHIAPRRVDRLVRLFDLGPTLLDLAGLPSQTEEDDVLGGRSLRPLMEGRAQPGLENVVRTSTGISVLENDRYKVVAAAPDTTLSWSGSTLRVVVPELALFEWRRDLDEHHDVADGAPLVAGEMLRQLSAPRSMIMRHLSPEAARLLRQAGYGPAPGTTP